jgi:hypothetical protein
MSQTDGWKIFPTEQEALDYCDLTWAAILSVMPDERIPTEVITFFLAFIVTLNDAGGDVRSVPGDVIRSVSVVPFLGLDHTGDVVIDGGESRKWAIPRETIDGQWAVPCLLGFDTGGPEPEWPIPEGTPILSSLNPATTVVGVPVTVTLEGRNFVSTSVVMADGAVLPTTFVDKTTLTVSGTPLVDGTSEIVVRNATYTSNALTFTVTLE